MLNREYFEWFAEDVETLRKMSRVFGEWNKNKNKSFKDIFLSVNGEISPTMYDYFIRNSIEILNFMESTMLVGEDFIDNVNMLERYLDVKNSVLNDGKIVPTFNIKLSNASTLLNSMCHNHMLSSDVIVDQNVGNRMVIQKSNIMRDDGELFAYNIFTIGSGGVLNFDSTIYSEDLEFISKVWFETIKNDYRCERYKIEKPNELKRKLEKCGLIDGKDEFFSYCEDNNLNPDKVLSDFICDHFTINRKYISRKMFKNATREERRQFAFPDEHQFNALKNILLYYYSDYRDVAYRIDSNQFEFFSTENITSVAPIMKNCKNIAILIEKAKIYLNLLLNNINCNYYDISKLVLNNYGSENVCYSAKLLSFILTNACLYNNFANVPLYKLDRMRYLINFKETDDKSLNFLNSLYYVRNAVRHGQFYIDFSGDTHYTRWHNDTNLGREVASINNKSLLYLTYKLFEFDINNYGANIDVSDLEVMHKSVLFGMDNQEIREDYYKREAQFIELTKRKENRGALIKPLPNSTSSSGNGESGEDD